MTSSPTAEQTEREALIARLKRQRLMLDNKDSWSPDDYATNREITRRLGELYREDVKT